MVFHLDRHLLSGNEAIARGAYEAGVKVCSAYPGTPSTEIFEELPRYKDALYCEWAPNEKVATEVAYGASIAGVRSLCAMKHVGVNVAADPIFTAAYNGVGGGFVVDGKIQSGWRGLGGDFGHICVAMDGEPCSCGRRGCWEAYASASALIRQAAAAAAGDPGSALNGAGALSGRSIYAAAAAGDAAALAVTERYAQYVGVGLVSLLNALFPEVILLGGGVSGAGDALLTPVRRFVAENAFIRDASLLPEIRAAALGGDAGMLGAAALVPKGK